MLRVAFDGDSARLLPDEFQVNREDNQILAVALGEKMRDKDAPVVVVSKDINLRIKADALGLRAEDYESDRGACHADQGGTDIPLVELAANIL